MLGFGLLKSKAFSFLCGQRLVFLNPESTERLPHHLEPGRRLPAWRSARSVAETLLSHGYKGDLEMTAECIDGVDYRYASNTIKINSEKLLELNT